MAKRFWDPKAPIVEKTGAAAGRILVGVAPNNQGIRLLVTEAQPRGKSGPVVGPFRILAVGTGRHASALEPLLHRDTNAAEVLQVIRGDSPGCVNVVNANLLAVEL
jgi:hypothetical protein